MGGGRRYPITMGWRAIVAAVALVVFPAVDSRTADLETQLDAAQKAYSANIVSEAKLVGRDTAYDYLQRLIDDRAALDRPVPYGFEPQLWSGYVDDKATLDLSLVDQILSRNYRPLGDIRGLGETLLRSSRDGTMQPVAVYVPQSYRPGTAAPLVVFLHGNPQSETDLLAPPFIGQLAERTGTIIIAPYARGRANFRQSPSDVYDALDAATGAFTIDTRKRFLVGYSMGGFAAYEIGPMHSRDWTAVMSIAGGLLDRDTHLVIATMNQTPFYVLAGSADGTVPNQYSISTAEFLQASSVPISYYFQAGGTHSMMTLLPALTQAWDDMHAGVVRAPPPTLKYTPLLLNPPHGTIDKPPYDI
jgi:dienelactone hydrolase